LFVQLVKNLLAVLSDSLYLVKYVAVYQKRYDRTALMFLADWGWIYLLATKYKVRKWSGYPLAVPPKASDFCDWCWTV